MDYIDKNKVIEKSALLILNVFLISIGILVMSITGTLLLGGVVEKYHFIIYLSSIPVIYLHYYHSFNFKHEIKILLSTIAIIIFVVVIAFKLASTTFDHSSDGQTDHQEAIIHISNGWNYIHDKSTKQFAKEVKSNYVLKDAIYNDYIEWFSTKGTYITAAAAYKFFGDIEYGKGFTFILAFAAFCSVLAVCLKLGLALKISYIIAFIATLNPIVIVQVTTFYVDAQNASLITIFIALTTYLMSDSIIRRELLFIWALTLIILFNTKLTDFFFAGFLGLSASIYLYIIKKDIKPFMYFIVACFFGLCIIGLNPYILNLPTYIDVLLNATSDQIANTTWVGGQGFAVENNQLTKFMLATFSNTHLNPVSVDFKIPFTIQNHEYLAFRESHPDLRIAAFGPLFSGALILSFIILMSSLIKKTKYWVVNLITTMIILGSVLLYPESWWYRFVPHAWLVPITPAFYGYLFMKDNLDIWLARIILFVLSINLLLIIYNYTYGEYLIQNSIHERYELVSNMKEPVNVYFSNFKTNRLRFDKFGISVKEVPATDCESYIAMMPGETRVCFNRSNASYKKILKKICRIEGKLNSNGINFWLVKLIENNEEFVGCTAINEIVNK